MSLVGYQNAALINQRRPFAARYRQALMLLFWINTILCTINFFLTPNPYAALHSGGVALDTAARSETFFIQSNLVTAIALLSAYLWAFRTNLVIPWLAIIWGFSLVFSGIVTSVLFIRPQSYIYDIVLMTMVIPLARYGANSAMDDSALRTIFRVSSLILVVAVVLALVRPNVWGYLPFEFSRESRGEATLAAMTAVIVILPAAAMALRSMSVAVRTIMYIATFIAVLSTATRSYIVIVSLPFIAYVALQTRGLIRLIILVVIIALVAYGFSAFQDIFILQGRSQSTMEATLTGRLPLWDYYWNSFKEAPLFGQGAFLLERAINYSGDAKSEIGILKTAAEYGIIVAALQFFAVAIAGCSAFITLRRRSESEMNIFTALIVIALTPNFLLQDHARLLNMVDVLFWYSVFWQLTRMIPILGLCIRLGSSQGRISHSVRTIKTFKPDKVAVQDISPQN